MFERFTDRARRAVVLAGEASAGQSFMGTHDLLVGLIREGEGVAAAVLKSLGVTEEWFVHPQDSDTWYPPFSPDVRRVLEASQREALLLGHNYVGTEHLLLALAHEPNQTLQVLARRYGLTSAAIRSAVLDRLADTHPDPLVLDAHEELQALKERHTKRTPKLKDGFDRPGLVVEADALNRAVILAGHRYNVTTVREYAQLLVDACDFVDRANPKWSSSRDRTAGTPKIAEGEEDT